MCFGSGVPLPEAGPVIGDENTVARIARVITDLDGLIETEAKDEVRKRGDILSAVVCDACDAIAVEKDLGCG
jgi:hypothetical protein